MKRFSFVRTVMAVAAVAVLGWSCTKIETELPIEVTQLSTPTGVTVGTVTSEEASFSWTAVTDAASYTAELKTSPYGAAIKSAVIDAVLTDVAFAGLEPGTDYYFHVRANHASNEAKNSYFSEFVTCTTTTVDPQYTPLATPQNVYVDAMVTTLTTLTFHWDVVENAASYSYKITWTEAGAQQERAAVLTGGSITSVLVEGLTQGTVYKFQVRANPENGSEVYRSSNYSAAVTASTIARLEAPVVTHVAGDATINSLHFTWTAVEGAVNYSYAVSENDGDYGAAVTTTYAEVDLTNLLSNTKYTIKVSALPVEGSVTTLPSVYSLPVWGKTLNAGAPQLAVPSNIHATDATTQTSLTVEWDAVPNAVSYVYQFGEAGEETPIAANSVTISAVLTPETGYQIRVKAVGDGTSYLDSNYSSWETVSTLGAPMDITVSTPAELTEALNNIHEGGVITMNPGNYYIVNGSNALNTISIKKSLTLQGSAPVSATSHTYINAKDIKIEANVSNVVLRNLEYSAINANTTDGTPNLASPNFTNGYFVDVQENYVVNNLTIEGCFLHDVANAVVRANRTTATSAVNNFTFNNNLVYNFGGKNGGVIDSQRPSTAENTSYTITNNTIAVMGQNVAGATGVSARLVSGPQNLTNFTATISNNTWYNFSSNTNNFISFSCGTTTVSKNIFYRAYTGGSAEWVAAAKGLSITGTATNNVIYNYAPTGWTEGGVSLSANGFTNDPGFTTDYTVGASLLVPLTATFIPTNSNVLGDQIGDPRWLPGPLPMRRR